MDPPEGVGIQITLQFFHRAEIRLPVQVLGHDSDDTINDGGKNDVRGVHQHHAVSAFDHKLAGLRARTLFDHLHQAVKLLEGSFRGFQHSSHPLQSLFKPVPLDGLQKIIDSIDLERPDGIVIISSYKNKVRQMGIPVEQFLDDAKAVQARHLDIQKYEVRTQFPNQAHRFHAILPLPDDLDLRKIPEQVSQFVP